MRARDERHVQHAGQLDIGDVAARSGKEAAMLLRPPALGDVAEMALVHGAGSGRFTPRIRSAASVTASTICL